MNDERTLLPLPTLFECPGEPVIRVDRAINLKTKKVVRALDGYAQLDQLNSYVRTVVSDGGGGDFTFRIAELRGLGDADTSLPPHTYHWRLLTDAYDVPYDAEFFVEAPENQSLATADGGDWRMLSSTARNVWDTTSETHHTMVRLYWTHANGDEAIAGWSWPDRRYYGFD